MKGTDMGCCSGTRMWDMDVLEGVCIKATKLEVSQQQHSRATCSCGEEPNSHSQSPKAAPHSRSSHLQEEEHTAMGAGQGGMIQPQCPEPTVEDGERRASSSPIFRSAPSPSSPPPLHRLRAQRQFAATLMQALPSHVGLSLPS